MRIDDTTLVIVLRCLQATADPACQPPDETALARVDWVRTLRFCRHQRIAAFVAKAMKSSEVWLRMNADLQKILRAELVAAASELKIKWRSFEQTNAILESQSIPVVPLKGIALAHSVYRESPYRYMGDVDLFIRREDVAGAVAALKSRGFGQFVALAPNPNRWQDELLLEAQFRRDNYRGRAELRLGGTEVDLHWDATYPHRGPWIVLPWQDMWQRSVPCPELASNIRLLQPDDLYLHVLLHALDRWCPRLSQILDLMLLVRNHPGISDRSLKWVTAEAPNPLKDEAIGLIQAVEDLVGSAGRESAVGPQPLAYIKRFLEPTGQSDAGNFRGWQDLRRFSSLRAQALFLAGYLVPSSAALSAGHPVMVVLRHWMALVRKCVRMVSEKLKRALHLILGR